MNLEDFENFLDTFLRNKPIPFNYFSKNLPDNKKLVFTVIPEKKKIFDKEFFFYSIYDKGGKKILSDLFLFEVAEKIAKLLCEGKNINHIFIFNLLKLDKAFFNKRNEIVFLDNFMKKEKNRDIVETRKIRKEKLQDDMLFILKQIRNYF